MERQRPSMAATSGSKRKRQLDNTASFDYADSDAEFDVYAESTSNKRTRSQAPASDVSASEDNTFTQPRSIRRKKGSQNLSNLNLRHAAKIQTPSSGTLRGSKFQEGSLTDKPSDKPPTFFTRFSRTESRASAKVDTLMDDYHMGVESQDLRESLFSPTPHETGLAGQKKDDGKRFFQFGRQLANLHPVSLWKSIWNDTKEELVKEKMEEEERKARLKAEAEAKYAEMKEAGQFAVQRSDNSVDQAQVFELEACTPKDSGVVLNNIDVSADQERITSAVTVLRHPMEDPAPSNTSRFSRGLKDRFHLKKPSLSNLKHDLRRMRSDLALAGPRDPSSSVSPIKQDMDSSTLRKAASRADLRKQHKLSKRVSDLEFKLEAARMELHEALEEASPMPKLAGKHERFTPGTIKRPKFFPGKLPSLPSERILMAQQDIEVKDDGDPMPSAYDAEVRKATDHSLKQFLLEQSKAGEDEDTIRASHAREYPPRAASLFNLENDNIENQTPRDPSQVQEPATATELESNVNMSEADDNMEQKAITNGDNMDLNTTTTNDNAAPTETTKTIDYAALDAKLKALDANVKTARKIAQPKKRKTAEKDTVFKPAAGFESDDEDEWEKSTPKKKRKSTGKSELSPPNKRAARGSVVGNQGSPPNKKREAGPMKGNPAKSPPSSKLASKFSDDEADSDYENGMNAVQAEDAMPEDEVAQRNSTDSQAGLLDPVYEEEEETPAIPVVVNTNNEPSDATTKNTANIGTDATISDQDMITRAALAAKQHPGRQNKRSTSPLPPAATSNTTAVNTASIVEKEVVKVVPGANGVPDLPKPSVPAGLESLDEVEKAKVAGVERARAGVVVGKDEKFEWPDDVF
ncbi:hypothetical protein BDY17DRAFT_305844 [Neohortaea acidophila]|uniref:Uncharacterized protein n=1 Tax=Neohortaea acidophila TaxID=245834 RepID=A0A6A6PFN3_9PEZI|nr:uncharacterized protein BDY17DRAFT_305844 [Neohortaea acidophila]KAF2478789.1 hypothetical protein BDY17DRAFT_305844 [Neohortaea acidophila]